MIIGHAQPGQTAVPDSRMMIPGSRTTLQYPWAGGLNSCQFCAVDIDLDGINDLLVFDRHGNRKLTFINRGTTNTIGFDFEPGFALQLPELHDWVLTADYNCDGKMDLFTYGMGGVRVFRNISDTSLKFSLVTELLESYYYNGKVGILVTSVDYPALADVDNDGDLDLLTFFGLGSFVEYHENLSMEKYGHCDSLEFRLADPCWGKFKESEGGNRITLNIDCQDDPGQLTTEALHITVPRHTGSTLFATDLNSDGLKDLILGDVDYPGLVALFNGGTIDTARMVAQDTVFPAASVPVHLFSFPAVSCLDIDNDGRNDLLVSPFDPALHTSDNYNGVWFYKNTGTASQPQFEFQPEKPFLNDMMDFGSASHPVLFDIDGDGLQDLFVGNDGFYDSSWYSQAVLHSSYTSRIAFFRNTGTTSSPVFTFMDGDLGGLAGMSLRGIYPAFGDLNGDGLPDMIAGNSDGSLYFLLNTGLKSGIPSFDAPSQFNQNIDPGDYSTPQFFDLDKDGMADLIVGERNGNLNWYKNTGTSQNPVFSLVTDSLGKVNVTNYNLSYDGFITPCFSRMNDGTTFLIAGSNEGRIHLYGNIDDNLDGKFTESAGLFAWLSAMPDDTIFGWQTSPAIARLSDPLEFDMITGNFSGGLNYITKRTGAIIIPGTPEISSAQPGSLNVSPNPADQTVTISSRGRQHRAMASRLVILDHFGRKLLDLPFGGKTTLSVSGFRPGIYLVRSGEAVSRLIIVHP